MLTPRNGQGNGSKEPQIHFGTYTPRFGGGETPSQDGNNSSDGVLKAKTIRLDFPRFNEEDLETWTCRAGQFFEIYNTPTEHRISLSSFHMDGKALVWSRELRANNSVTTRAEFVRSMQTCFGKGSYDNPMETLSKLK